MYTHVVTDLPPSMYFSNWAAPVKKSCRESGVLPRDRAIVAIESSKESATKFNALARAARVARKSATSM